MYKFVVFFFFFYYYAVVFEKVKVIDETGCIVPIGMPGEICLRGYGVMTGYWGDVEQTNKAIGPDRWYKTGYVKRFRCLEQCCFSCFVEIISVKFSVILSYTK